MRPRHPLQIKSNQIFFDGRVSGGKTLHVAVRSPVARGMQQAGWGHTVLTTLTTAAGARVDFAAVLRQYKGGRVHEGVTQLPVPKRFHDKIQRGDRVKVRLQTVPSTDSAVPVSQAPATDVIDLFPYAPPGSYEPSPGVLVLRGLRSELQINRFVPTASAFWLAGFYQADGSKGRNAVDFTLAQANGYRLQDFYRVLVRAFSVDPARIVMEVLYRPDSTPAEVEATVVYYTTLIPAEVRSVRPRTGRGGRAGVLRVDASKPLFDVMTAWLRDSIEGRALSDNAALNFALGFLDGDGGITIESSIRLGLYDTEVVARRVNALLEQSLNWQLRSVHYKSPSEAHRNLRIKEALDLLTLGAFRHSIARGQLLLCVNQRLNRVRQLYSEFGAFPFVRSTKVDLRGNWRFDMLDKLDNGQWKLSQDALQSLALCDQLKTEIKAFESCRHPLTTGIKGIPNPLAQDNPELYAHVRRTVPWSLESPQP